MKRTKCCSTSTPAPGSRPVCSSSQELGVNPYKFGMIGSTDSHTALATAEEENFFGKHSGAEPGPARYKHPMAKTANGVVRELGHGGARATQPSGRVKTPARRSSTP